MYTNIYTFIDMQILCSTDIVYTFLTVVYNGICQYVDPVGWAHFFSHATKSSEV